MSWTFERVFYGRKGGLNLKAVSLTVQAFYPFQTLFEGTTEPLSPRRQPLWAYLKPFPDALEARPGEIRPASVGGFDSSILAKLYDRRTSTTSASPARFTQSAGRYAWGAAEIQMRRAFHSKADEMCRTRTLRL